MRSVTRFFSVGQRVLLERGNASKGPVVVESLPCHPGDDAQLRGYPREGFRSPAEKLLDSGKRGTLQRLGELVRH